MKLCFCENTRMWLISKSRLFYVENYDFSSIAVYIRKVSILLANIDNNKKHLLFIIAKHFLKISWGIMGRSRNKFFLFLKFCKDRNTCGLVLCIPNHFWVSLKSFFVQNFVVCWRNSLSCQLLYYANVTLSALILW